MYNKAMYTKIKVWKFLIFIKYFHKISEYFQITSLNKNYKKLFQIIDTFDILKIILKLIKK